MFASKKPSLNEWKNWAIGLVGNTMSSIDQATSRWFLNLINGLPRDYFAKTFDQVNYLDKRVWEGMFRASIEEIKEQLELGVSESIVEANLVKLQGLIGKYSLSPVIYENGLEELEDFISNLSNAGNYLKVLKGIRSEFREELKSQPALLKECIEGEANLGRKEGEYYKSLLDDRSLKNVSPERVISESPILDKATVSKRRNNNYKLRNISKLLFSNPGQALTLFLAAQSAFASAANIQMSNSTGLAIGNDTLSFDHSLSNLSEFEGRMNSNLYSASTEEAVLKSGSELELKEKVFGKRSFFANSGEDVNSKFIEVPSGKVKELNDANKVVEVLTYVEEVSSKASVHPKRFLSTHSTTSSNGEFVRQGGKIQIKPLQDKVKKLKDQVDQIKNSSLMNEDNKKVILSLQDKVEGLQKDLDNAGEASSQNLKEFEKRIRQLITDLNRVYSSLFGEIEEMERIKLKSECVDDILEGNFKDAEEKLKRMNDPSKIHLIVKETCNNNVVNFDLLFRFGKTIGNIKLKLELYGALYQEIERVGHKDHLKTIGLAEVFPNDMFKLLQDKVRKLRNQINKIENSTLVNDGDRRMNDTDELVRVLTYVGEVSTKGNGRTKRSDSTNSTTSSNGTFVRPDKETTVRWLQDKVKELEVQVGQIKNSTLAGSNDKVQIVSLQDEVKNLRRGLDNAGKISFQELEKLERSVTDLISKVNTVYSDLMKRVETLEKDQLPNKCADEIRLQNFQVAEQKLELMDYSTNIPLIVKKVYNNSVVNFDLLFRFIVSIKDIKASILFCEALSNEMVFNKHTDKLSEVVCFMKKKVIKMSRSELKDFKSKLPESVKNLVFSSEVCIKNVDYNGYLRPDTSRFTSDDRYVSNSLGEERDPRDRWKIECDHGYFHIKYDQDDEYLRPIKFFFSTYSTMSLVTSTLSGQSKYKWGFNFTPDNVYVNDFETHSSFLCSLGNNNPHRRVRAVEMKSLETEGCLWKLEDCSDQIRRRRDADEALSYSDPSSYLSDIALENTKESNSSLSR